MKKLLLAAALRAVALLAATPAGALFDTTAPGIVQFFPTTLTASTVATTGSFSATLTGRSDKIVSICGFIVSSGGTTTPLVVNVTVGPVAGAAGTLNYAYVFPSSGQGILGVAMPQCIAADAMNHPIVVTVPAGGAGTVAALTAWGNQGQ